MKHWSTLLCIAALTTIAVAAPVAAVLDEPMIFEIPAQSLDTALLEFARRTGIQVISAAADVADRKSAGVRGRHTPRVALGALLKGSSLSFVVSGESSISITRRRDSFSTNGINPEP